MPIVLRGWMRVMGERRWRMVATQDTRDQLASVLELIVADKKAVIGDRNVVSSLILTEHDETPTKNGWLKKQRPR